MLSLDMALGLRHGELAGLKWETSTLRNLSLTERGAESVNYAWPYFRLRSYFHRATYHQTTNPQAP